MSKITFDNSGVLAKFDAYGFEQSTKQIQAGTIEIQPNNKGRDYYALDGIKFYVLPTKEIVNLNLVKQAPNIHDITPYFTKYNDKLSELCVDERFACDLDAYMLGNSDVLYSAQDKKGFEVFLNAMSYKFRVFEIPECNTLNVYFAQKVRKNRKKRTENESY
ncbi:hypothetical protein [Campylobacter hyointestinalis]|uniref:Uncharacterized protein n=1 Tax=Campylobacter hyointestinalis subsp. hyointestinalis TaxID=91352 RepID=A0A9W5EX13_CAMHY|nr:hypothetical protein [Campylobacter hyointestinalis]CUU74495.1 Uncharacterised protein [Campylobacter hyointestinalis subsp. hyointestinalis]CUU82307.1 Uncharacterised protein [Campylobacter hyointestinalis subsp. hyointestinalis]